VSAAWDLLTGTDTVAGRLVSTAAIAVGALVLAAVIGRVLARRFEDRYRRYYVRKITGYAGAILAAIAIAILWRPFAGQLGLVIGLVTAGLAFAMQELIGALAGWLNILSGGVYRVGDRVRVGGVIDVSPLRTTLMEIGSGREEEAWVRGRQYTGRIASVSNKATFTDPVFNYSGSFDYVWEELTVGVGYDDDWQTAERIMREEAQRVSADDEAAAAIRAMLRRYPIARTEVAARVFVRTAEAHLELAARFVVPVRSARASRDEMTRRVLERLAAAGITVASTTPEVTVRVREPGG
jgi:small-conductance mechanosensitive channel